MRRKLSLLALVLSVSLAGACANPAAPSRDGEDDPDRCGVVVGTHTRCADSTSDSTKNG